MLLNRLGGIKAVTVLRIDATRLSCPRDERVYVQIDGEYAGRLPAEIRIVTDALSLMKPGCMEGAGIGIRWTIPLFGMKSEFRPWLRALRRRSP